HWPWAVAPGSAPAGQALQPPEYAAGDGRDGHGHAYRVCVLREPVLYARVRRVRVRRVRVRLLPLLPRPPISVAAPVSAAPPVYSDAHEWNGRPACRWAPARR